MPLHLHARYGYRFDLPLSVQLQTVQHKIRRGTYFSEPQDLEDAYMEDGEDALLEAYIEDAKNLPDMGDGSSCYSADPPPRNYCRHQLDALSDDAHRFYLVTTTSAIEDEDINLALAFQDNPDLMADD